MQGIARTLVWTYHSQRVECTSCALLDWRTIAPSGFLDERKNAVPALRNATSRMSLPGPDSRWRVLAGSVVVAAVAITLAGHYSAESAGAAILAFVLWLLFAAVLMCVSERLGGEASFGHLFSSTAFSLSPLVLAKPFIVFGIVPGLAVVVCALGAVALMIRAISKANRFSLFRAISALLLIVIPPVVLGWIVFSLAFTGTI